MCYLEMNFLKNMKKHMNFFKDLFIYLRERVWRGKGVGERESQVHSTLSVELHLMPPKSWPVPKPRVEHSNTCPTQVPLKKCIWIFKNHQVLHKYKVQLWSKVVPTTIRRRILAYLSTMFLWKNCVNLYQFYKNIQFSPSGDRGGKVKLCMN